MPIWTCAKCLQPKPMVDFKRSPQGNYLKVCAVCSPSKYKVKIPNISHPRPGFTPVFCDKCGYNRRRDGKTKRRCYCRKQYDRDGNLRPLRKGIDRSQWFELPKDEMAERMRWYQSGLERKAAAIIQELAYEFHIPYKAQEVVRGYIVDFVYPKIKLIIEIDGPHHDTAERQLADANRTAHLQQAGFQVVRISYSAMDSRGPQAALEPVRAILASSINTGERR